MAEAGSDIVPRTGLETNQKEWVVFTAGMAIDPEEWLDSFINNVAQRDMTWQQALDVLRSLFEGTEKIWFDTLHENKLRNPSKFKIAFLEKFGLFGVHPDELIPPIQDSYQLVARYYEKHISFGRRWHMDDREMRDNFMYGLREPMRNDTYKKNPGTLHDARKIAVSSERFHRKKARAKSKEPGDHVTKEDLDSKMAELLEQVKLMAAGQKHENTLHCLYCDRPRHNESTCRLKEKNMQKLDFVREMLLGIRYVSGSGDPTQNFHSKCAYCLKQNHNGMCELSCPLLRKDLQSINLLP